MHLLKNIFSSKILISSLRIVALNVLLITALCCPSSAWTIFENGQRRPLILAGPGDVRSGDLPDALQSAMRVDALDRTVEWRGDRGWIRAAEGEILAVKNGHRVLLPRPVRLLESVVSFPEELLKLFPDIFSFVEMAAGAEGEQLNIAAPPAVGEPAPGLHPLPAGIADPSAAFPATPRGRAVRTIVIDAGHGGSDPGAKGKAGAVEKDIVLAIALETARALQERDPSLKVILTRRRDEFISLQDRAKLANTNKGDLFVSIHANSVRRNSDAGGFEVYHLDIDGANDEARAVAAVENAAPGSSATADPPMSGNPDVSRILGDVMQLQYINASLELSHHIADRMTASLEGASKFRGSKGAFFYVLKDVMAPAVLIEVGFVTNDWEASFLQKSWYQRKIAAGIVEGILNFKQAEEARLNGTAAPAPADTPSPLPLEGSGGQ